jgi:hypothetical protein
MLRGIIWQILTDVSELLTASIIRAIAFETSVNIYRITQRNIPEDSHLYTRRRENLKSYTVIRIIFHTAEPYITYTCYCKFE